MHSNIAICLACPFRGPADGACPCTIDGRDIKEHAEAGDCPKGFYGQAGTTTPAAAKASPPRAAAGTELKKMLKRLGIAPSKDCLCNEMADAMDINPPAWSMENIEIIVDVMRSEAAKRGLPFIGTVGRLLVRRAVRNAQRVESRPADKPLSSRPQTVA